MITIGRKGGNMKYIIELDKDELSFLKGIVRDTRYKLLDKLRNNIFDKKSINHIITQTLILSERLDNVIPIADKANKEVK